MPLNPVGQFLQKSRLSLPAFSWLPCPLRLPPHSGEGPPLQVLAPNSLRITCPQNPSVMLGQNAVCGGRNQGAHGASSPWRSQKRPCGPGAQSDGAGTRRHRGAVVRATGARPSSRPSTPWLVKGFRVLGVSPSKRLLRCRGPLGDMSSLESLSPVASK